MKIGKRISLKHRKISAWENTVAGTHIAHLCCEINVALQRAVGMIVDVIPILMRAPFHAVEEAAGGWQQCLIVRKYIGEFSAKMRPTTASCDISQLIIRYVKYPRRVLHTSGVR